jgi:hypothetical protein
MKTPCKKESALHFGMQDAHAGDVVLRQYRFGQYDSVEIVRAIVAAFESGARRATRRCDANAGPHAFAFRVPSPRFVCLVVGLC